MAQAEHEGDKVREAHLRCSGHAQWRDCGIYWTKDAESRAARQEETRKTTQKVQGGNNEGHAEGSCDRGGNEGQGETEQPLKEATER